MPLFKFITDVHPITFTYANGRVLLDLEKFEEAVNDLTAHGGGDHEEYAFSAMLAALDFVYDDGLNFTPMSYNSEMIVITDATSKLPELRETVKNQAKDQEVSINFILSKYPSDLRSFYEDIANETGGIVYQDSHEAWSIVKFHNQLRSSSERKRRSAATDAISVNVSRFAYALQVFLLAGNSHGVDRVVNIALPDGSVESANIEDNVMIYLKYNPLPGNYLFDTDDTLVEDLLIQQDISLDISLFYLYYLDSNFEFSSPTPLAACKS